MAAKRVLAAGARATGRAGGGTTKKSATRVERAPAPQFAAATPTRAVLVGPSFSDPRVLPALLSRLDLGETDLVVGVDLGVEHCLKAELEPDFCIGDWDSIAVKKLATRYPHITLPPDKDRSDFYFALVAAIEWGVSEIICVGFTGGRIDHQLAALFDIAWIAQEAPSELKLLRIEDEREAYYAVGPKMPLKLKLPHGTPFSVFAACGEAKGVSISGARFVLKSDDLIPSSHGVSNRVAGGEAQISLKKGGLWVVHPRVD